MCPSLFLMIGSKATEDTPALIYSHVQNASWMIPIVSGGIFFIPLFLLLKTLTLYKNKNLFTVIQKLLGKYIGFVVCLLIFVIKFILPFLSIQERIRILSGRFILQRHPMSSSMRS